MLDRIPPVARHLVLMVLAAALTWVAGDFVPDMHPGPLAAVAGAAATLLLAWVTPLTRQYGVGAAVPEAEAE